MADQHLLMKNVLMVIKSNSVSNARPSLQKLGGESSKARQLVSAVRHSRVTHVGFYLQRSELHKPPQECCLMAGLPALCELSESYRAAGAGTMAVLWRCCWCLLNAHSGCGGLKSTLKGLADQRGVSSVSFAAESGAREMIQTRRWRRALNSL